ncbi:MAG: alpha-mannosidase [Opitutales bacterium]|nr:alpha-mannosidase [Opitutales bacterium]
MYPEHQFLQIVLPRLRRLTSRLRGQVWTKVADLTVGRTVPRPKSLSLSEAKALPRKKIKPGTPWGNYFDQAWFCGEIPRDFQKRDDLYLHWQDQGESTLYLEDIPHGGFDVAHREQPLPSGTATFWVESFVMQTAIWHHEATGIHPDGNLFQGVWLKEKNALVWEVYHDWLILLELAEKEKQRATPLKPEVHLPARYHPPIESCPPLLRCLLRWMDDAVNRYDTEGLAGLKEETKAIYERLRGDGFLPKAVFTGHAHLDLVWLWPERMAEHKAVHTFSNVLRLMDRYPEFRFSYSQPASYQAVERLAPEVFAAVQQRMASGQWEATGAMQVESDTQMACGEALAQSFLLGQKNFTKLRGEPARCCWLPDAFGYSSCLPQIMAQTGVSYFFTTKLTWSNITRFPYSSFHWEGNDGSRVLSHVTQELGYNNMGTVQESIDAMEAYRQVDRHPEFLLPTGFGDGGGGPTEEICERVRRMKSLQTVPPAEWDRVEDFFDRLNNKAEHLPSWRGELYLEYHRGVLTTHGRLKERFRAAERSLQIREAAAALTGKQSDCEKAWERVVFSQFHDYIPGTSIIEVYDEALPELENLADDNLKKARQLLSAGDGEKSVFNPLPYPRIAYREQSKGRVLPYFLPPLSGVSQSRLLPAKAVEELKGDETHLQNQFLRVDFDSAGRITHLVSNGEEIPFREPGNQLYLFPDHPHHFDAWDIDRQTLSLGKPVNTPTKPEFSRTNPLSARVSFSRNLGTKSRITVHYELKAHDKWVNIRYEVDWQERGTLLKAVFPTSFSGAMARFGAPFGSTLRPQLAGPSDAEAQWESAGNRWAAVQDDNHAGGLFVVTEAKYGFSCREGLLGVSLLRSALMPGSGENDRRNVLQHPKRKETQRESYSDLGTHSIQIAIGRMDPSAPRSEHPAALADLLFTDPIEYIGNEIHSPFRRFRGGDSIQPAWVKPTSGEEGIFLRLHETLGHRGKVAVELENGYTAQAVDLSGKPIPEMQTGPNTFQFTPYQIFGLKIEPTPSSKKK